MPAERDIHVALARQIFFWTFLYQVSVESYELVNIFCATFCATFLTARFLLDFLGICLFIQSNDREFSKICDPNTRILTQRDANGSFVPRSTYYYFI